MIALVIAILVSLAPAVTAPSESVASADSTGSLRAAASEPASTSGVLRGQATWYASATRGNAAAGPGLRRFIGHGWRGASVDVCRSGVTWIACVRVRLTDWCACGGDRIIDLSDEDFRALAVPLSAGVVRVKVALGAPPRENITQPPTDTAH